MTKYNMIMFDISKTGVGNISEGPFWSRAWRVELHMYYSNWRGTVKCDKQLAAIIPFDYSEDDDGKSVAVKYARMCLKNAQRRNEK